jgi:hypothetical protein
MSPTEIAWRAADHARKAAWTVPSLRPRPRPALPSRRFVAVLPEGASLEVPPQARAAVLSAADEVLAGRYETLGCTRTDMADPDWALDPATGKRAPLAPYCFHINYKDEGQHGNVKQVWELSRLHHVTVLAGAYALSREDDYAERAAAHLRSWWRANSWLSGVNWTSGIEVGLRLISLAWTRRLLAGWEGAAAVFEHDEDALVQIWAHQRHLATFHSRGSSANNHAIAEAAGLLTGTLAFPWWPDSPGWAEQAASWLEADLAHNTFPGGVNREMAFDYHGFVAELGFAAAAEADLAGRPLSEPTWELLARMTDVVAATVDTSLAPPRYGDGDDGRALVVDPKANRWADLLALGRSLCGAPDWWPEVNPGACSSLLASIAAKHPAPERPGRRPCHFPEAGLTLMRATAPDGQEVWCRCDAGPHGFLSIAGHAHADALSLEVRHGGTEVLADPGTYCYHGEAPWRAYFRSTLGHNTLEIGGRDQSVAGGPFLWSSHARSRLLSLTIGDDGEASEWSAEHDGYLSLQPPTVHRRKVTTVDGGTLQVLDEVETGGRQPLRLAFHFGPTVEASLEGAVVSLRWQTPSGPAAGVLHLPEALTWRLARGETGPILGWYSPAFGVKQPTWTAIGHGFVEGHTKLVSELRFSASGGEA